VAAKADGASPPPLLSITQWLQHALDLYASVDEAVAAIGANPPPYTLTTLTLSDGQRGLGHMMLTDATGASAVIEPVAGGLAIHRTSNATADAQDDAVSVMTNGPLLPAMQALDLYQQMSGSLPGGGASPDRFLRGAFWRRRTPVPPTPEAAAKSVRSIMRTLATPIGVTAGPGHPESCQTQWTSVADSTRLVYWLEPAGSLAVTVVPLAPLNLTSPATPVRMLETGTRQAELVGQVDVSAWADVPAGGLPGMVGYKGPVHGDVEANASSEITENER
jgi:choloylglycine hydrolase